MSIITLKSQMRKLSLKIVKKLVQEHTLLWDSKEVARTETDLKHVILQTRD